MRKPERNVKCWEGPVQQLLVSCAHLTSPQEDEPKMGVNMLLSGFTVVKKRVRRSWMLVLLLLPFLPGPVHSSLLFTLTSLRPVVQENGTAVPLRHFFCSWGVKCWNRTILPTPRLLFRAMLEHRLELPTAKQPDLSAPVLQGRAAVGARSPLLSSFSAPGPTGWLGYD